MLRVCCLVTLLPALTSCSGVERLSLLSDLGLAGSTEPTGSGDSSGGSGGAQVSGVCGDGVLDSQESCDDGNDVDGDGCDASCQPSFQLSGPIGFSPVPLAVGVGETEDSQRAVFFAEALDVELAQALSFDLHVSGATSAFPAQRGQLPAGSHVNSYYFHFDTDGEATARLAYSVAFPAEVLAVIATESALGASDLVLGLPSIAYPTGAPLRGLDSNDTLTLAASRRTLRASLGVAESVDSFRVLTRVLSEPSVVTSGRVMGRPIPNSVRSGAAERTGALQLFEERRDVLLERDVVVDLSGPEASGTNPTPALIAAGTRVTTYLLHYDPVDTVQLVLVGGALTFRRGILGIAAQPETLDASDDLGASSASYPTGVESARGLEWDTDSLTIADDSASIELTLAANTGTDQLRIFVASP